MVGITPGSQAMQQGGMGLILTTLILTAPPMAAFFFQGTLGSFMAYSQIGGSPAAQPGPQGQPPGSYVPQQAQNSGSHEQASSSNPQRAMARSVGYAQSTATPDTGRMGAANRGE